VAVIAEGAAALPAKRRSVGFALLGGLLIANVGVCRFILADWKRNATVGDTLLNHSDPALLASSLAPYRNDALLFTNIGIYEEVLWASRGILCGQRMLFWGDDRGFEQAVQRTLALPTQRRVFVAFPAEREKNIPGRALARTGLLTAALEASGVRWSTQTISIPGVGPRYELFVVDKGQKGEFPSTTQQFPNPTVRGGAVNLPSRGSVTGWVKGTGFREGDVIVTDQGVPLATAFGNSEWLTFRVDEASIAGPRTIRVQVLRPETGARSQYITLVRP
jgi:hypothetical protein